MSNLAVGASSLALAAGWAQPSTWFRALRLIGLIGITLTFVVFHAVLRELQDRTGDTALADFLLHNVSPIMCVVGWLWFGPRGQVSWAAVRWALAFPVVWGVVTLVRGHVVGFYPYPFTDPGDSGYVKVAINLLIIGLVFVSLAAAARARPEAPGSNRGRRSRRDFPACDHGLTVSDPVVVDPDRQMFVDDPSGNVVELHQLGQGTS